MEKINNIADYFIKKGEDNNQFMTHLKLQKLCYYAQAWSLAIYNKPLVNEEFEAWVHGPVNNSLYRRFRTYGFDFIFSDDRLSSENLSPETLNLLDAIWRTYGHLDAKVLEGLTHSEEPWIEARKGLKDYEYSNNAIKQLTMKTFYKKRFNSAKS
nr:type II toxin-antitoxin system antitoxin SocA domain-containing protein [Paenibacillus xylanexedens]